MRADRPPSRSLLPAPYRSPWLQLGHDLAALAGWLRLKLREFWRRNSEGDLWRPPFWPEAGGALFWPLLLALLLALPMAPLLAGRSSAAPSGPATEEGRPDPALEAPVAELEGGEAQPPSKSAGSVAPEETPMPLVPAEPAPPQAPAAPAVDLTSSGTGTPSPTDPLLAALEQGEDSPLIAAMRSHPARGLVVLRLDDDYTTLTAPQRRERAERWLARSRDLGFEALELRDRGGALLGRSALVGSGMILLDPDLA